ncbi:MAG: DUF4314 domain-containing protein [Streptosporangiaceae bacterium]
MTYQRGDRIVLVRTSDPHTRLVPGTPGTVTSYDGQHGQLAVAWDDGSTLAMLLHDGDQVRLLESPAQADNPGEDTGLPGGQLPQDITDPATGGSRLLSEPCATCILAAGDRMHLGPERLRVIIAEALAAGSFVVCHDTLTYGDYPDYGPAICRGFFNAYSSRSPALILLQACHRLLEVAPPEAAPAGPDPGDGTVV